MFWGWLDQNSGVHGKRKPLLTYNGENGVSTFSQLLLIQSFLYLQVTGTCIKSRTSSKCGQIGPLTTELAALERLKISHRLTMGKCCLHASSFIFYRIIINIAGNQDMHKSSVEFDFGPNQITRFGVTCPWVTKISHFGITGCGSSIWGASPWYADGRGFDPDVRQNILSLRFGHENVSTTILSLPLIQEGQLSVTGERVGTKYW